MDPRSTDDPWPTPPFGRQPLRDEAGEWLDMDCVSHRTREILSTECMLKRYILVGQLMLMNLDVDAFARLLQGKGVSEVEATGIALQCAEWCDYNL
jgi:hypothetical protein